MTDEQIRAATRKLVASICDTCSDEQIEPELAAVVMGLAVGSILKGFPGVNPAASRGAAIAAIDGVISGEFLEVKP